LETEIVLPRSLTKKQQAEWIKLGYEAKAYYSKNHFCIQDTIKCVFDALFTMSKIGICIVNWLPPINPDAIKSLFHNSNIEHEFMPVMKGFVRPGALIIDIRENNSIDNLIGWWGTLDGIQLLFPKDGYFQELIKIVDTPQYVYCKRDIKIWKRLTSCANAVITDTGTGNEFEIAYNKDDAVICKAIEGIGI